MPRGQVLHFHVTFRPRTAEVLRRGHVGTTAAELENFAAIEVLGRQAPVARIDVVMHELFHFLYWTRPLDRHLGEPFIRAMGTALLPTMEHVASEDGHRDDQAFRGGSVGIHAPAGGPVRAPGASPTASLAHIPDIPEKAQREPLRQ